MKGIDIRSAAVGALLTFLAAVLVSDALGQRPALQAQGQPTRYQIAGGQSIAGTACLYVLDQTSGDLFCLDSPQATGKGSNWNVGYSGNVGQLVARARR
jgi:hypothetical protein